jgi:hypothetical protein
MMKRILIALVLLLIAVPASAQDTGATVVITTPTEGQQLFGLEQITGTATHPSQFVGYTLDWSNMRNPDVWLPIQARVNQQVDNGVLGQWDTVAIPDGLYQIRLRVSLNDGSEVDFIVQNLAVVNSAPTGVPTQSGGSGAIPAFPTTDPLATPLINQPPTVTPRATFEQPEPVVIADNSDNASFFDPAAASSAFCTGVYFTVGFFGIIVAYLLLRKQLSPHTRRLWWQIRSEFDDERGDR